MLQVGGSQRYCDHLRKCDLCWGTCVPFLLYLLIDGPLDQSSHSAQDRLLALVGTQVFCFLGNGNSHPWGIGCSSLCSTVYNFLLGTVCNFLISTGL